MCGQDISTLLATWKDAEATCADCIKQTPIVRAQQPKDVAELDVQVRTIQQADDEKESLLQAEAQIETRGASTGLQGLNQGVN
jgi:hypothetical protein